MKKTENEKLEELEKSAKKELKNYAKDIKETKLNIFDKKPNKIPTDAKIIMEGLISNLKIVLFIFFLLIKIYLIMV